MDHFNSPTGEDPVLPETFVEDVVIPLLWVLGSFIKYQLFEIARAHFWVFSYVS